MRAKLNLISMISMIKFLKKDCHTAQEISEMSGFHHKTILEWMPILHKTGMVWIEDWDKRPNIFLPRYRWQDGAKKDVPKPKPMTNAQRQKLRRERIKLSQQVNPFHLTTEQEAINARALAKYADAEERKTQNESEPVS